MDQDKVRVIKISKEALFEFIYEMFNRDLEAYFDVGPTEVSSYYGIDFENGQFICCVMQSEDEHGNLLEMPKNVDLRSLMKKMPDTTNTMFWHNRYREYTKQELIDLSDSPC